MRGVVNGGSEGKIKDIVCGGIGVRLVCMKVKGDEGNCWW